jgi:signal transduction histidine kinase
MKESRAALEAELTRVMAELQECREQHRPVLLRQLEQAERRYDELLAHMRDGCALHEIVCDENGRPVDYRFLAANAAFGRLTGLDPAAVVGKTVREVLPTLEPSWIEKFGSVALTGVPMHFEQHSTPLQRDFEVTAFCPERGKFVVVFDDITDRKRLEAQLYHAQKMEALGQLAGGVAHEVSNVLAIIAAVAESIEQALPTDIPAARTELEELLAAVQRGTAITQKLRSFSRREALVLQRVELKPAIEEITSLLRRVLPPAVQIETQVPEGLAVLADRGALHQILINLANNARDAMPTGGVLTIHCQAELDRGCIRVRDSGTGMDQPTIDRIFDPFFTTKPAGDGTGLGMPVVQRLMRELGGTVEVQSQPSAGTEIRLELALATASAQATPSIPEVDLQRGKETILFAEDEAPLRKVAKRTLESLGYRVLLAGLGRRRCSHSTHTNRRSTSSSPIR